MPDTEPRYQARYRDGYYIVFDTQQQVLVPAPAGHYKKYREGYLWDNAALSMANQYNAEQYVCCPLGHAQRASTAGALCILCLANGDRNRLA